MSCNNWKIKNFSMPDYSILSSNFSVLFQLEYCDRITDETNVVDHAYYGSILVLYRKKPYIYKIPVGQLSYVGAFLSPNGSI